jgi:hypothetical protein
MPCDEALGNYFAGLVDGEGTFTLSLTVQKKTYIRPQARFKIKLCSEDFDIIKLMHETLGTGHLFIDDESVIFSTSSDSDSKIISDFFDEFKLRAKKSKDFEIWKEGLRICLNHSEHTKWSEEEFMQFLDLREKINSGFHAHNRRTREELIRIWKGDE